MKPNLLDPPYNAVSPSYPVTRSDMIYVKLFSDLANDEVQITIRIVTTDGRIQMYAETAKTDALANPISKHIVLDDGWLVSVTAMPIAAGARTLAPYVYVALSHGIIETSPGSVQLIGHCLFEEAGASWPWDPVEDPGCRVITEMPKYYAAAVSQSTTNPPTAVEYQNQLGGSVVWTRTAVGTYEATLVGAFPTARTFVTIANFDSQNTPGVIERVTGSNDVIVIITNVPVADPITGVISYNLADDVLNDTPLLVIVFP